MPNFPDSSIHRSALFDQYSAALCDLATVAADYLKALVKAGIPDEVAVDLLMQWHEYALANVVTIEQEDSQLDR